MLKLGRYCPWKTVSSHLNSSKDCIKVLGKEKESCCLVLGVLYKTGIEALSRCSRAATAKKRAKNRGARAKLSFC